MLHLSAMVEASLDFADDDDAGELPGAFSTALAGLAAELAEALSQPSAEPLREGYRVALAGPPNAGKSTLFNALLDSDAAITASLAGTTRDVLVATSEIARADLVLWLGPEGEGPAGSWEIAAQCDRADLPAKANPHHRISARSGEGMQALRKALIDHAQAHLPKPGDLALNRRQSALVGAASQALGSALSVTDPLILAECLRQARLAFDALLGRTSTEDVLDALFGRFCIGK